MKVKVWKSESGLPGHLVTQWKCERVKVKQMMIITYFRLPPHQHHFHWLHYFSLVGENWVIICKYYEFWSSSKKFTHHHDHHHHRHRGEHWPLAGSSKLLCLLSELATEPAAELSLFILWWGDVKYDYDDVNDRQSCLCDDAKYDDEHDDDSEEEDLTMYTMGKESPW